MTTALLPYFEIDESMINECIFDLEPTGHCSENDWLAQQDTDTERYIVGRYAGERVLLKITT